MFQAAFIHLLLLIIVANASPIIVRKLLHNKYAWTIDGGLNFIDGRPLFGYSKTWRGIAGAVLITAIAGLALGYTVQTGALIGLLAMAGDLFSSFIKRRLKLPPSSMAPMVDQIPESFLPALLMMQVFGLNASSVTVLVVLFIIFELLVSVILYRWGIRQRPY